MKERTLIVRAEQADDFPAIEAVNRRAFGRPAEANLVSALRPSLPSADCSRVAVIEGKIVGHVLFSPILIETDQANIPALALAPLAVLPEYQRQGIGSALIRDGLSACRQMGAEIVIVLGHSDFYSRFGFRPARLFGIRAPFEVPDPAFMALELQPGALKKVQGMVRYPPPFTGV